MSTPILRDKGAVLFFVLGAFLLANALLAELIGVKLFHLEDVLGVAHADFPLFGEPHQSFMLSVGVLSWPLVFLVTDIVNDYFGVRGVRFLTLVAAGLIAFAFCVLWLAIRVPPDHTWWRGSSSDAGVPDMQAAFAAIFGQSMNIIVGSLTAFLVSQLTDALTFRAFKRLTGERRIWLRATGSTLVSQLVDSLVVTWVAFWLLRDWSLPKATAMALTAYGFKFLIAIASTPLIYLAHAAVERWLGKELAESMRKAALEGP
jgi:uncharacterized integral membrane protein (TIGR00697 family)